MPGFDQFRLLFVLVPAVLTVAGLLVIAGGVRSVVRTRRFLRVAQQVPGTVTDHRHRVVRTSDSDRVVTIPVLRFTTRTGQRVEAEQSIALRRRVPERGAEVAVLYDPADPARAGVAGTRNGVTADAVFRIVFGAVFALFAGSFLSLGAFGLFGLFR